MSSNSPPNYKEIEKRKWREYAIRVVSDLDKGDENLNKRIQTFVNRFGYTQSDVEEKIRSDKMFAASFAKTPSREGFHEKMAADWLNEKLGISVEVLPKSGKNAIYVSRDGVISTIDKAEKKPSKSLDFYWHHKGLTFYAMHKFTHESGGAQGSAHKEMLELLMNFQPATNRSKVLIVIVDGDFYTSERMDELRNLTRLTAPKSYAVHIEEVPAIMSEYWINQ